MISFASKTRMCVPDSLPARFASVWFISACHTGQDWLPVLKMTQWEIGVNLRKCADKLVTFPKKAHFYILERINHQIRMDG